MVHAIASAARTGIAIQIHRRFAVPQDVEYVHADASFVSVRGMSFRSATGAPVALVTSPSCAYAIRSEPTPSASGQIKAAAKLLESAIQRSGSQQPRRQRDDRRMRRGAHRLVGRRSSSSSFSPGPHP